MTIGYEGLNLDHLFSLLDAGGVDTIVDVRQSPISRKKGFSKRALATSACAKGFRYVHLAEFGCPKPIRDDYKRDGDWERYTARFLEYIDTQEAAVFTFARRALTERCCLVCFEADPNFCHRSLVAERVAGAAPLAVVHLGVKRPATP